MSIPLDHLNERQKNVVVSLTSCIVVAGPGTGKTATLLAKLAYLLDQGVRPEKMLVLTYTHAAAEELLKRLETTTDAIYLNDMLFVGTMHSWCMRYLKNNNDVEELRIATERDQDDILVNLGTKKRSLRKQLLAISCYKQGICLEENFGEVVEKYNESLKKRGMYDFDDLLIQTEQSLNEKKEKPNFEYILVDEFQDFNQLQYNILRHLLHQELHASLVSTHNTKIYVVGDPKQAIYGFRGGSAKYFDELRRDIGNEIETIELNTSYRCDQKILDVAGAFWVKNEKLQSYARNSMQPDIGVFHIRTPSEETEAHWICEKIISITGNIDNERTTISHYITQMTSDFSRVCIAYRNYHSVIGLAKKLDYSSLPYVLYKEKDFLKHEEVRIFLLILNSILYNGWLEVPAEFMFVRNRLAKVSNQSLREVVGVIVKALEEKFHDSPYLLRLIRLAWQYDERFETVGPLFLEEISLLDREDQMELVRGKISVMSLHATKGLEFDVMFIVGVEEGLIPSSLAVSDEEIEEEKRLLYVGITRARHQVYMTSVNSRVVLGKSEVRSVSRFLKPLIERKLLQVEKDELGEQFMKKKKEKKRQMRMW